MTRRIRSPRRSGFSLVELLTVISIIALLISILLPAIGAARRTAKAAACRNTIRVLEVGVEQFRADQVVGGAYPESAVGAPQVPGVSFNMMQGVVNPHTNAAPSPVCGASFLVWALAGADLLGTPGFRDLNGNSTWRDDTGSGSNGLYGIGANQQPLQPRYGPFVGLENMRFPKFDATKGGFVIEKYSTAPLSSTCFLDAFDRPILYYRANPAGSRIVQRYYSDVSPTDPTTTGMYYLEDNLAITGWTDTSVTYPKAPNQPGLDLGSGVSHRLGCFPDALTGSFPNLAVRNTQLAQATGMGRLIADHNVTAVVRPQRSDSFLLLSPGPDGRYGTSDDIGNFNINK